MTTNDNGTYYRPESLMEVFDLMQKGTGKTCFLSGGDFEPPKLEGDIKLIDLQNLGWDYVREADGKVHAGALASLSQLEDAVGENADLLEAFSIEAGRNVRNSLSVANFLKHANGRSPLLTCLVALNAQCLMQPGNLWGSLEDYTARINEDSPVFLNELSFNKVPFVFSSIGRTPKDLPIICIAVSQQEEGLCVAIGGTLSFPAGYMIYQFEDNGSAQLKDVLQDATDEWASAAYRQDAGMQLLSRLLAKIRLKAKETD